MWNQGGRGNRSFSLAAATASGKAAQVRRAWHGNGQQPSDMRSGLPWAGHMPVYHKNPRRIPGTPPHPIYCKHTRRIPWRTTLIWSKKIYARPLPRVYAIFLSAIEYSAKAQHNNRSAGGGRRHTGGAPGCAYTLTWAYIFDMSSTSRNMGAKYAQEFGPGFSA